MLQHCIVVRIVMVAANSRFAACVLEGIRDPVRDEARHTPLPAVSRDRVQVLVGPMVVEMSQKSFFFVL
jgi:hypothetical protein